MKGDDILKALKARRRVFTKMMAAEGPFLRGLRNKSRSVRMGSAHTTRTLWYRDRVAEVDLAISFLKGKITSREYIHHLLDDDGGNAARHLGNALHGE